MNDPPASVERPIVGVIMGSKSDWETMHHACEMLASFHVPYEKHIVSAHRTPDWMADTPRVPFSEGWK